ncbi:MAG: Rpn family recombination-promoting nuclease/putative transposase, partial [Treponema sp.]|nr:Rpn family recombination-promoting nuclease/putative transposase [Treponema sp.]
MKILSSKGVRLDVYLKDEDKIIDVELQAHPKPAIGKRARYYQSMIDIDSLMKGQDYLNLKDSYILFICKFDPFKDESGNSLGLPCYTFKNTCHENSIVNLNDNSIKVFYNANAYKEEKDERIQKLLHFICTNEPGEDDFSKRLAGLVEKMKDDEKFRSLYNAMNLHDFDIQMAAKQEGEEEKAIEAAVLLVKKYKVEVETAAKDMKAPLEKVLQALAQE